MTTKKSLDLAAGRLANIPSGRRHARSPASTKANSYGRKRLGITADAAIEPANQPTRGGEQGSNLARILQQHRQRQAELKRPVRPQPPPKPSIQPSAPQTEDASVFRRIKEICTSSPRRTASAAAVAGVVVLVSAWLIWRCGGGKAGLGAPSVARAAPAARPIAPNPVRPAQGVLQPPPSLNQSPQAATRPAQSRTMPRAGTKPPGSKPGQTAAARIAAILELARSLTGRSDGAGKPPAIGLRPPVGRAGPTKPPTTAPAQPSRPAAQAPPPAPAYRYMPCPPGITLSGVVQQPDGALANINGRFVAVGETVDGAKVVRITPLSVEMELDGKRFLVGFNSGGGPSGDSGASGADEDEGEGEKTKPVDEGDKASGDDDSDASKSDKPQKQGKSKTKKPPKAGS